MRPGQLKSLFALTFACTVWCSVGNAAPAVRQIGSIDNPRITESSGLVASRQYTNVFWTHNDGGKSETLFAISREGKTLAEFKVAGANFDDWEDIAIDNERRLYLADTGDNNSKRKKISIFRVDEPDPSLRHGVARVAKRWQLRFPGGPVDCESLFILQDSGYLVTKVTGDRKAEVYRFALDATQDVQPLEFFARLTIDSPVAGAGIAADASKVAFVAKSGAYVYDLAGDPAKLRTGRPYHARFKHDKMEACTFVEDGLLATAESREILLFSAEPFRRR